MSSKVYRIYSKGGTDTIVGWSGKGSINPYGDSNIKEIKDPNGANSKKEITSIPSPFARIDLVKTAFAEVNKACNPDGRQLKGKALREELDKQTIYHKMISDSLDVGEIFFNLNKFKDKFDVIVWNPESLDKLEDENEESGLNCYADTLKAYWNNDSDTYNFKDVKNIYILNYKQGTELHVVGATSPVTLFFSNANDLSDVVTDVQFCGDKPFDGEYKPLYQRDREYIKYLRWLSKQKVDGESFSKKFEDFFNYLKLTEEACDSFKDWSQEDKDEISKVGVVPNGLERIKAEGGGANDVEVLGLPLYQKGIKAVSGSDFEIKSTKREDCNYLVLPVEEGINYADWTYTTGKWGKYSQAPIKPQEPISERVLPYDGSKHPYLTISDFLEDTLLESENEIDNNLFYEPDIQSRESDNMSFLLPLKPLFFEFFSVDDLINNKMLSFVCDAGGGVKAILRIPVKRGENEVVEYERRYHVAEESGKGHIVDDLLHHSTVSVMPALPVQEGAKPYYVFSAITPSKKKMKLSFYQDGKQVSKGEPQNRNLNDGYGYDVWGYTVTEYFECLQITTLHGVGIAVPKFMQHKGIGTKTFSYAIDFGTSNTHVEYCELNSGRKKSPSSVEYDYWYSEESKNRMVGLLLKPTNEDGKEGSLEQERQAINQILIPRKLMAGSEYHFPTRTVLSYRRDFRWNEKNNPYELHNICFTYGKMDKLTINDYANDIKWSENEGQMNAFAADLMFMLRNNTLALEGDLSQTKIMWFYPNSMSKNQKNRFGEVWQKAYEKFFEGKADSNVTEMSESYAPIAFYNGTEQTVHDLLSIDVGGGTTDMCYAEGSEVKFITSFRFAGNSLFEDSIGNSQKRNGIISYFEPIYKTKVEGDPNASKHVATIYEDSDAQIATSLFTLKSVDCFKTFDIEKIDFVSLLRNDQYFKMEFIIFFTSILYHAGKIIKGRNLELPRHIAFSGNGSNIIRVLEKDCGKKSLQELAVAVLEVSSGKKCSGKLEILGLDKIDELKSTTCKGGLLCDEAAKEVNFKEKNVILKVDEKFTSGEDTYSNADEDIESAFQETMEYFAALKKIGGHNQFDFKDAFAIELEKSWEILDDILSDRNDVKRFVQKGIAARVGDRKPSDVYISETFFFYPIACILQLFSEKMSQIVQSPEE